MTAKELNDELTVLIGRIQRADVEVEDDLRIIWNQLAGGGFARAVVPREFGALLRQCRQMFAIRDENDKLAAQALKVFDAAHAAHEERNQLVHDLWIMVDGDQGHWASAAAARKRAMPMEIEPVDLLLQIEPRSLSDFRDCVVQLRRVGWRLRAVSWALSVGRDVDRDTFVLEDRFSMSDDGLSIIQRN